MYLSVKRFPTKKRLSIAIWITWSLLSIWALFDSLANGFVAMVIINTLSIGGATFLCVSDYWQLKEFNRELPYYEQKLALIEVLTCLANVSKKSQFELERGMQTVSIRAQKRFFSVTVQDNVNDITTDTRGRVTAEVYDSYFISGDNRKVNKYVEYIDYDDEDDLSRLKTWFQVAREVVRTEAVPKTLRYASIEDMRALCRLLATQ